MTRLPLLLPLLLAACATGKPQQVSGRWIGPVTPTTSGVLCTPSKGEAEIHQGHLLFSPNEGTWVLNGSATPDGAASAEKLGQGVNKQPFLTTLEARWTETSLDGTYKTPRCTFDVHLARQPT